VVDGRARLAWELLDKLFDDDCTHIQGIGDRGQGTDTASKPDILSPLAGPLYVIVALMCFGDRDQGQLQR
jgi:hypothetical protein